MTIERIPFSRFSELTGTNLSIDEELDFGAGWFVTSNGDLLGRLSVNLITEQWNRELYCRTTSGWTSIGWRTGFSTYNAAEQDLLRELLQLDTSPTTRTAATLVA